KAVTNTCAKNSNAKKPETTHQRDCPSRKRKYCSSAKTPSGNAIKKFKNPHSNANPNGTTTSNQSKTCGAPTYRRIALQARTKHHTAEAMTIFAPHTYPKISPTSKTRK